eukprot:5149255-Pyramimonas_sp.AAC.1
MCIRDRWTPVLRRRSTANQSVQTEENVFGERVKSEGVHLHADQGNLLSHTRYGSRLEQDGHALV